MTIAADVKMSVFEALSLTTTYLDRILWPPATGNMFSFYLESRSPILDLAFEVDTSLPCVARHLWLFFAVLFIKPETWKNLCRYS